MRTTRSQARLLEPQVLSVRASAGNGKEVALIQEDHGQAAPRLPVSTLIIRHRWILRPLATSPRVLLARTHVRDFARDPGVDLDGVYTVFGTGPDPGQFWAMFRGVIVLSWRWHL